MHLPLFFQIEILNKFVATSVISKCFESIYRYLMFWQTIMITEFTFKWFSNRS